jgi:HPt (histidine-containing phosphotransfer) domain-containing protein
MRCGCAPPAPREQAHALKGSAGMIGAVRLSQLCHDVEKAALGKDPVPIPGLLVAIQIELRSVERLLTTEYA